MIKAIILLKRRDDLDFEAFRDWLLGTHAPKATRLPGIKGYQVNMAQDGDGPTMRRPNCGSTAKTISRRLMRPNTARRSRPTRWRMCRAGTG